MELLQDMIGDLTSAPEPIAIKIFSQDPALLRSWAPRVAGAIKKIDGVVDVLNGIDNTISGPATVFQVDQAVAARAGFTAEEIELDASAIVQGEPAPPPIVVNDRAYTIRVRFPEDTRASLDAIRNTLLVSSAGRTATLGSLASVTALPGQTEIRREDLQRDVTVNGDGRRWHNLMDAFAIWIDPDERGFWRLKWTWASAGAAAGIALLLIELAEALRGSTFFLFLYGVNLLIHEAGHMIFGLTQIEFIGFIGGTLL